MDALDYPRIDATVSADGLIQLEIQDHAPRTFQDATTEEALVQVWKRCATVAQTLNRDVKVSVREGSKTSHYTVGADADPVLHAVTEEVERTPLWKRKVLIIPAAALLAVTLGGGAIAAVASMNAPSSSATATAPADITLTLDNGTFKAAAISGDGQHISYIDGDTLYVVDSRGALVSQTDLTKSKLTGAQVSISSTGDGFIYTAAGNYFMWGGGKFSALTGFSPKTQALITRAGEPVLISRTDTTPNTVQKIGVTGTERYRSPAEGAAFIATSKGSGLWASTRNGGSIITATASGTETGTHALIAPAEGATLAGWVGATANGEVVTLWRAANGGAILAVQGANAESVTRTFEVPAGAEVKIDPTGTLAIAGVQVMYLNGEGSYPLPSVPVKVTARAGGGFSLEFEGGATGEATTAGFIASSDSPVIGMTADGHRVTVGADRRSIIISNS